MLFLCEGVSKWALNQHKRRLPQLGEFSNQNMNLSAIVLSLQVVRFWKRHSKLPSEMSGLHRDSRVFF